MLKKLTLLGMAIAAVAVFVAPAVASAALVTQEGKTLEPIVTTLTGVSTNSETTTELGTLKCANVTVQGTLTENDGTVKATGNETGNSATECSVEGNPLTITSPKFTTLESTSEETGTGHVGLTFVADLFGLECHFESEGASGVFHYDAVNKGSSIEVTPTALVGPCGSATFHGDFLITAGGKEVELE